jgi:hypothetical protein
MAGCHGFMQGACGICFISIHHDCNFIPS